MRLLGLVALALLLPTPGLAQLPVQPPAGMVEMYAAETAPDTYALPVRPVGGEAPVTEARQGTVRRAGFRGPRPETPLGAIEAVAGPLAAAGFGTVLDCADNDCGGFDFTLAIETLRQPAMMINPLDFHQRTMTGNLADGAQAAVSLLASRFGETTHLQVVTVTTPPPARVPTPISRPRPPPAVAAPSDDAPDRNAGEDQLAGVLTRLEREGRVVLEGVDFDSAARDHALVDSPILDTVAALLTARPDLEVMVVGHSDGTGALEPNIALSQARAEAIVTALVARGVAPDRLAAAGAGWLAPVASNATEAGRAANRRVELVLR